MVIKSCAQIRKTLLQFVKSSVFVAPIYTVSIILWYQRIEFYCNIKVYSLISLQFYISDAQLQDAFWPFWASLNGPGRW